MIEDICIDHKEDQRDEQTKQLQSQSIKYFCDRNMEAFQPYLKNEMKILGDKLQQSEKQKIVIQKMEFDDGRYVEYKDTNYDNTTYELTTKTIIYVTGVPGGVKYFSKIEESIGPNFCRQLNFYIPGLDKKDERRGSYQGRLDDLVQLLDDFMERKVIEKAVFIVHSFGGLVVKNFAFQKPNRVEGLIQIASVPLTKWRGQKIYEEIEKTHYNIDVEQLTFEQLQDDEFRNNLNKLVTDTQTKLKNLPKDQIVKFGPISIFGFNDIVCMLKFRKTFPGGLNEMLHRMTLLDKNIPRMMAYSSKDAPIEPSIVEDEIYQFVVGETASKRRIIQQVQNTPQLDQNHFCSNYLFRFDDATHNLQQEKGHELGILAKHFLRQLNQTEILHDQPKL